MLTPRRPFLLAAALLGSLSLSAASLTWDPTLSPVSPAGGAGTWNTNTTANWSNGAADQNWTDTTGVDTAIFGGAGGTVTIATVTANALNFTAGGYTISGTRLNLGGTAASITTAATFTETIGAAVYTTGTATFNTATGGVLNLNGDLNATGSLAFTGAGTVNIQNLLGSATLSVANGATVVIGATSPSASYTNNYTGAFNVAAGGVLTNNSTVGAYQGFGGATTLTVAGTYNVAASTGLVSKIVLDGGTVNATTALAMPTTNITVANGSSGTVNLTSGFTGNGAFTVNTGVTANIGASGYTNNYTGTLTIAAGGILNNNSTVGAYQGYGAGATVSVAGTYNVAGSTGLVGNIVLNGGVINAANSVALPATTITATGSGGTVNFVGGFTGGAAFSVNNGVTVTIGGAAGYVNNYTGAITVAAGGVMNNNSSVSAYQGFGAGSSLTVAGTYNANTGNALRGLASVTVSSGGNIVVNAAATLAANTSVINNGTLTVGASLTSAAPTLFTLSGTGGYTFNGTLNLNGVFNSAGAGTYTLITGGSGTRTDTAVTITGFSNAGMNASFSQGVLTLTAVPEPTAYGLAGAGAMALCAGLRRRSRRQKA